MEDGVLGGQGPDSRIRDVASPLVSSRLACSRCTLRCTKLRGVAGQLVALWHLTSLDAPTVAAVWALAIGRCAHLHLEPWILFLLAGVTWTVYVMDRLLDARRAINARDLVVLRDRHHFHWRHRRWLVPIAFCTAIAAVGLVVSRMPSVACKHDSILAAAALAYFSGVHAKTRFPRWLRRLSSKEMLVGILFASGCAAPTLSRLHSTESIRLVILSLTCLALLAWLNCAAISTWESQATSTNFPVAAALLAVSGLAIAIVIPPALALTSGLLSCAAISSLLLLALHVSRNRLSPITLRALADLVLLVPAVLLIPGALSG